MIKTIRSVVVFLVVVAPDDHGGEGVSKGKALWMKAKGVKMITKSKVSAEEAQRIRRSKLVPFSRQYHWLRWTLATLSNLGIFVLIIAWTWNEARTLAFGAELVLVNCLFIFCFFLLSQALQIVLLVLLPSVKDNSCIAYVKLRAMEYGFI